MSSSLEEIIGVLEELKRMHQLNYELLEQLNVACAYLLKNYKGMLPNEEKIASLLSKALTILAEIHAETPRMLQYQRLADEKKQPYKTDGEVTEPPNMIQI